MGFFTKHLVPGLECIEVWFINIIINIIIIIIIWIFVVVTEFLTEKRLRNDGFILGLSEGEGMVVRWLVVVAVRT